MACFHFWQSLFCLFVFNFLMQPSPLKCLMSLFYDVIIQITAWFLLTPILLLIINDSHQFKTLFYQISFWLISGVYFIFSWLRGGQTIGMRAWNLQLISENNKVSFFVFRYLLASIGLLFFAVSFIPILFKKQMLHDSILGSKIICFQSE